MGTLREIKSTLRYDKKLRPMLVRSTLHEVLIDLDGDGVADIALIDATHDGDIDTVAIDTTGNGDFNLYVSDVDGNGIPDAVQFYKDGEDVPESAFFGRRVEDRMVDLAVRIQESLLTGRIITEELFQMMKELEAQGEKEYAKKTEEDPS